MRHTLLLSLTSALVLGCRGTDSAEAKSDVGGTMIVTTAADADFLLPPLIASTMGAQVGDMLFERLATPDSTLGTVGDKAFTGELAERWSWGPDSLSIAFSINPKARWHDGRPVTARDVRFTFDVFRDPAVGSPVAPLIANIDSVSVRDSLTPIFWFKKRAPEQFFEATYHMHIVPEHALAGVRRTDYKSAPFARKPVGSGPFRFARWVPGSLIEVVADTAHYRGRPRLDRVIWSIAPDPTAATTKLFAGEADFLEVLRPEHMRELAKHPELTVIQYPSLAYGFLHFNLRDPKNRARPHPLFGDRALRRALTMGVDRRRIVQNVLDSLGAVSIGPVTRALAMADTTIPQIPYDLGGARRILDSLGWRDANDDGVREKNGRPLRFTVLVPSSSANRVRMAVLLQEALKQVGARADLEQLEFNVWSERQKQGNFDAVMGAWQLDLSPATIRQTWSSAAARSKDGSNYGSSMNPQFDAYVDSAMAEMNPARSKAYYRRAYETIIADAPAIWLYELVNTHALHERLQPVGVRADAWWANLEKWSIPPGERIARDNLGLRQIAD